MPVTVEMSGTVQRGSRVTLHFTLSLKDGTVVDSTQGGQPASFTIGRGELLEILEQRLLGLMPGDSRHFELSAEETAAITSDRQDQVQSMARADFPPQVDIQPGQIIGFSMPNGEEVPGRVVEVTGTEVYVDFTHPLAGHDVAFDVEILDVA